MLSEEQLKFYQTHGYLHIPRMFDQDHTQAMRDDLDWMIERWATKSAGWSGPWRAKYMDDQTQAKSQLIAMHDLQFYARSWMKAVTGDRLCGAVSQLIAADTQRLDGSGGGSAAPVAWDSADSSVTANPSGEAEANADAVELHHSTLHVKPPETGHPFPMHQDWAFYEHDDARFVDVLVHLDDTRHENGEIRFLAGSHRWGALEHIREFTDDGGQTQPCTPHLPTDQYQLEDTVAVPANAGDVVVFNIHTIHGSYINTTDDMRRLVRVGYRHPANRQQSGQSHGRPGLMVKGRRERTDGVSNADPTGAKAALVA